MATLELVTIVATRRRLRTPGAFGDEIERVTVELHRLMRSRRTAVMVLDRCAGEIPELAAVWFGEGRYALVDLWADYLELRSSLGNRRRRSSDPGTHDRRDRHHLGREDAMGTGTSPVSRRHCRCVRSDDPQPRDRRTTMNTTIRTRPGFVGRHRSRQSGLPTGLLGRFFGRAMEGATADSNDLALAMLDLREARTVLDVGFGQGRTVSVLLRDDHLVIGVDASPTMVKQATARNRAACRDGRATLRHCDGITIPFPDETADAAITVNTIYFMADPAATITEIARVLRPGGTLAVACRTSDTPTAAWIDAEVYRIPSAAQVIEMLHAAGFNQVDHRPGDTSNRDIQCFAARLPAGTP